MWTHAIGWVLGYPLLLEGGCLRRVGGFTGNFGNPNMGRRLSTPHS